MARRGLLIGVSEFDDRRLAALNAPQSDVQTLSAILRDPARGGFDQVAVSINEDFLTLRDRLAALFDGSEPDDTVLLYYSGHGIFAGATGCSWLLRVRCWTARRRAASRHRKSVT